MRVLHVISDRNIGGAGVLLCNLLRHFDRSEVQSVVAMPRGSALRERVRAQGIPVRELREPCDRWNPASVAELMRIIREERPDIVHANAAICARVAGRLTGKAVVHTRHCCFPEQAERGGGFAGAAQRKANRFLSDRVIATAESAARDLLALGIPRAKITVILNGSEPVREVAEAELEAFRKKLGIDASDFCVGICARLEPYKGQDVFLRAARAVADRMPERRFRFLIVGDGTQRAELERLTDALDLREQVRFTGFVADVAPIYRLLRVHVNCSTGTETSCLAVSEGMSASLPTVVSDFGGNRAMLEGSGAGYCLPAGNVLALAEAILRLASRPDLERAMRHAARERYEQKYTAVRMAEQLTAVYRELLFQKFGRTAEAMAK